MAVAIDDHRSASIPCRAREKHRAGQRVNRVRAAAAPGTGTATLPNRGDADNNGGDVDNTALTNGAL
jgi:hypothetical protein